jgi:hypothetical protein
VLLRASHPRRGFASSRDDARGFLALASDQTPRQLSCCWANHPFIGAILTLILAKSARLPSPPPSARSNYLTIFGVG